MKAIISAVDFAPQIPVHMEDLCGKHEITMPVRVTLLVDTAFRDQLRMFRYVPISIEVVT